MMTENDWIFLMLKGFGEEFLFPFLFFFMQRRTKTYLDITYMPFLAGTLQYLLPYMSLTI